MNIVVSFIISVLTFLFFYLLGVFYNASFNISEWSEFGRYVVCLLGGLFSPLVGFLNYFKEKI